MGENKLKTAVLGLNEAGRSLAEAASRVDYFQIQAVADRDINLAEKVACKLRILFVLGSCILVHF